MTNSPQKKIIFCITKANWGGAQRYVYDLSTSLDPGLYDVSVLVGSGGSLVGKLQDKGVRAIVMGGVVRDVSLLEDIKAFFRLLKIFYREKPDIVHLNSSKMGLLGALAGRILRIPKIIFTGHGWAFNEDRSNLQKKIIYWLHKLTIILSHKTIAVSEQTKKQIQGGNLFHNRIVVIRNGVGEIDFFDREEARVRILGKLPAGLDFQNKIWFGTVSELHENKGLKYLIEAVHLLDLAIDDRAFLPVVIIIGDGESREKLQERINRCGLQDNIFLAGRVEDARKYLKAFDIFTLTSITEALPYVLLEAGQAGLPIIASGVGGIPEVIDDRENGILVRPKEPEEIMKAIDYLIKNPDKVTIFSDNIKLKIRDHFNKDTMIRKTLEVYNR